MLDIYIENSEESTNCISLTQKSVIKNKNNLVFENMIKINEESIHFLIVSPDNAFIYIASYQYIFIFDINKNRIATKFRAHDSTVSVLMLIAPQYFLFSGGFDGMVNMWELETWNLISTINLSGWVYAISQLKKIGCAAVIVGMKNDRLRCCICIWNYQNNELIITIKLDRLSHHFTWAIEGEKIIQLTLQNELFKIDLFSLDVEVLDIDEFLIDYTHKKAEISALLYFEKTLKSTKVYKQIYQKQKDLLFLGFHDGNIRIIELIKPKNKLLHYQKLNDKPINDINIFQTREKNNLLFVRSNQIIIIMDMDMTILQKTDIKGPSRIIKSHWIKNDSWQGLILGTNKGEILIYKITDKIIVFFQALKTLGKLKKIPYISKYIFEMIFDFKKISN